MSNTSLTTTLRTGTRGRNNLPRVPLPCVPCRPSRRTIRKRSRRRSPCAFCKGLVCLASRPQRRRIPLRALRGTRPPLKALPALIAGRLSPRAPQYLNWGECAARSSRRGSAPAGARCSFRRGASVYSLPVSVSCSMTQCLSVRAGQGVCYYIIFVLPRSEMSFCGFCLSIR